MTAGRHNLTRRLLLGAAFGVPALGASGEMVWPAPASRWARAVAAYRRAGELLAALGPAAPDERFDDLQSARLAVLRRLLLTPAPDLSALSLKIDLIVDEEVATLRDGGDCLEALKADGRRLAGAAVAGRHGVNP